MALEGALKLKEITYIPADAYAAGEMKHGPIALLDNSTPVVACATDGPVLEKMLSNIAEVKARGAEVIAIATEGSDHVAAAADQTVFIPRTDWVLQPILAILPLQLLAYHVAPPRPERGPAAEPGEDRHGRVAPATTSTLYDWAGGEQAFTRLIDAFYDRVEGDELLSPLFPGGVTKSTANVTAWWSEVFGGPPRYTEELGGYERMVGKHRGLAITPEQRLRFATLMSLAADDAGLPDDPEFRSAFVAYVEWGRGSPCTTHSPAPRSSSTPPSRAGAGARHPRSSRSSCSSIHGIGAVERLYLLPHGGVAVFVGDRAPEHSQAQVRLGV